MAKLKTYLKPFFNLKYLLSFGIAWMITNGWSYLGFAFSMLFNIEWLKVVSSTYIAFLYFPFTFEKLITIPLSIFFQEKLFPNDIKLHIELLKMHIQAKNDFKRTFKKTILRKELKKMAE